MAFIAVAAVVGIHFIQKNIFNLTQKSTPYQIKTFNHQRALQSHASNLLKVAASDSIEEFKKNSDKSAESLGEEIKAADDLTTLGSSRNYEHDQFAEITKSIESTTNKSLLSQRDTLASVSIMKKSLADASGKLQSLDSSIRKLQHGATGKMVTDIYSNARDNEQTTLLADVIDGLKDLNNFCAQLLHSADKDTTETLYANISVPLNKIQTAKRIAWTDERANEDFGKRINDVADKTTEAKDLYLAFLSTHDANNRGKATKAVKDAQTEISYMLAMVKAEADKSIYSQINSSEGMSASVLDFSSINTILILSSETIFSSAVISSLINYSISVRNLPD